MCIRMPTIEHVQKETTICRNLILATQFLRPEAIFINQKSWLSKYWHSKQEDTQGLRGRYRRFCVRVGMWQLDIYVHSLPTLSTVKTASHAIHYSAITTRPVGLLSWKGNIRFVKFALLCYNLFECPKNYLRKTK